MRFDVLTLFPDMIIDYCSQSIIGRAIESQIIYINTVNPRDYTEDKHKKVDDTPYGGGAGMVLMAQPYVDAYESVPKFEKTKTIMLSPQGQPLSDKKVNELAQYEQLILLCGIMKGLTKESEI